MDYQALDRRARRLLWATRLQICRHLGVAKLDPRLVSELYLRIRDTLAEPSTDGAELTPETVDDLAVTIYMVAVAEAQAEPVLLAELKKALRTTVNETLTATGGER